jgi:phosphomannomutase
MGDLWWTKWHWDRFLPEYFGFLLVSFIPPVLHYTKKRKRIIIITGSHNKPQGCGASVASAAGPFTTKGTTLLRKFEKYVANDTASHLRRPESSQYIYRINPTL